MSSIPNTEDIDLWTRNDVTKRLFGAVGTVLERTTERIEAAVEEGDIAEAKYWLGYKAAHIAFLDAPRGLKEEALAEATPSGDPEGQGEELG